MSDSTGLVLPVKLRTHPFKYSFTTCFKEEVIVDLLKPKLKGKVLEMGCGSAYFAQVLHEKFPENSFEYYGVDISQEALNSAQSFLPTASHLKTGSVSALPYVEGEFDTVLYLDVIEHVDEDQKSLEEAFRVIKKGGALVISTPNASALLTDTVFCEYLHDHGHMANHRAGYTAAELSEKLIKAGFKVEEVRYSNVFLSELLITLTKLGYRTKKKKYGSQADLLEVSDSGLFALHKYVLFPLGYLIGKAEELLLGWALKGHCLIIRARKSA